MSGAISLQRSAAKPTKGLKFLARHLWQAENGSMRRFVTLEADGFLYGSMAIEASIALDRIPRLRGMVADRFEKSSVTHADGELIVELQGGDVLGNVTLRDQIVAAIEEVFPDLESHLVEEESLGKLWWDDRLQWFHGKVALGGKLLDLFISTPLTTPDHVVIRRGREVVDNWSLWWRTAQPLVLEEGLALYNDHWRPHDEEGTGRVLNEREFLQRLSPSSLHVYGDRRFQVAFGANGMFGEHGITVEVSADDQAIAFFE